MSEEQVLEHSPLGSDTAYVNQYDASLLYPIARDLNWKNRGIERSELPFIGNDIWTGYEVSWLNTKGKPVARIAVFDIDADSVSIIESKSFKLYLNSYNLSQFSDDLAVQTQMEKDLSEAAGGRVRVQFYRPDEFNSIQSFSGDCIDDLDVEITTYQPDLSLLETSSDEQVEEALFSHLLKSNCPVTGQPDWASIQVEYKGSVIDRESLLKYLISYREHGDFHEQCVENIFMDIWQQCKPKELSVYARYVRRGGLDINPFRTSLVGKTAADIRLSRQ